jgi:CxxC motif-containing protein
MKEFTCIVCPNGCSLVYDETTHKVTGNRCPRGAKYAENEMTHPMRSLTSTVRTTLPEYPVISVRTSLEVPKGMIPEVMKEINKAVVNDYLPINSVVIKNVLSTGADIITTAPMAKGK